MPTRAPSLLDPPIGFAHGGAGAHERAQTIEAFTLAVKLGATGIAANAWTTADGEVVLHTDGSCRVGLRKRAIAEVDRSALPDGIPSLAELLEVCRPGGHVSLDVADGPTARRAVAVAREAGGDAVGRLWLCSADRDEAVTWKEGADGVRIVEPTRFRQLEKNGGERQAAQMARNGVDAVRMPYPDWSAGKTTLFHRFGILALGSAAVHRRQLDELLVLGIDAVYSEHVDRMVDAITSAT